MLFAPTFNSMPRPICMSKSLSALEFGSLPTLSQLAIPAKRFEPWRTRDGVRAAIANFVQLNRQAFDFLGIKSEIVESGDVGLILHTSHYAGVIPLRAPAMANNKAEKAFRGKVAGSLAVTGRFNEDLAELIVQLPDAITVEYNPLLPLATSSAILPPLYLLCVRYLSAYLQTPLLQWRKFVNRTQTANVPLGSTLWGEYALRQATDPLSALTFRNKSNTLTTNHRERQMLDYVLAQSLRVLSAHNVPARTRASLQSQITQATQQLYGRPQLPTTAIAIHASDSQPIKVLKELANRVLNGTCSDHIAWRINFTEFFERYVQHTFHLAARMRAYTLRPNPRFPIYGSQPAWGVTYLEPDAIVEREEDTDVIDAKYKSHLYNFHTASAALYDEFRHDLHQIIAYTSICHTHAAFLVYPYTHFRDEPLHVSSQLTLHLIGIPVKASSLSSLAAQIAPLL